MTALAKAVIVDGERYAAGTDHAAMPVAAVDAIRSSDAWVGGVAPTLSGTTSRKTLRPADLLRPAPARAALGLGSAAQRAVGAGPGTVAAGDSPWLRPDRMLPAPPVTNNNWVAGAISNQTVAGTSRSRHRVAVDACDLRLVYGGFYTANPNTGAGQYGTDADQPAAIPVKASIEIAGVIYPVTFRGQLQVTVDPGGLAIADPLPVEVAAGDDVYVRTYTSSTNWYGNTASFGSSGTGGWSASDLTASGASAIADGSHWLYAPYAVLGSPTDRAAASVVVLGDSLSVGSGETANSAAAASAWGTGGAIAGGFISRALFAGNVPWVNIGHSGERAYRFALSANRFRRTVFLGVATHVICDLGVNDVFSGQTLSQLQGNWLTIWRAATRRGARVWQTTITPSTTSTDSWVTVGNQSTVNAGYEAVRVAANTWLRDGAPLISGAAAAAGTTASTAVRAGAAGHPLTGYFEVADLAESARNSGLWKANYTVDGLHPTTAGHTALAAGITPSALVV